jgi:hypothetical protein
VIGFERKRERNLLPKPLVSFVGFERKRERNLLPKPLLSFVLKPFVLLHPFCFGGLLSKSSASHCIVSVIIIVDDIKRLDGEQNW